MTRIHEPYLDTNIPLCRTKGKNLDKKWPEYRIKKYEVTPVTCVNCLKIKKILIETRAALEKHKWRITLVARDLGIDRCNVWDRMKKFKIVKPEGIGRWSAQREKSHCPRGHFYDRLNTYLDRRGYRKCRECDRTLKRQIAERRKNEEHKTT